MDFLVHLLEELEDYERNWLDKRSKFSIHIARFVSVGCLVLVTYFLTFLVSIAIGTILEHFNLYSPKYEYLWAIALLIAFPLIIPVFTNWKDREFCFTSVIVDLFETVLFVKSSFSPLKSYFEIVGFFLYVSINTILTIFSIANFVDEQKLTSYLETYMISVFSVIAVIHTVIYALVRILLLPAKTVEQRYRKTTREFLIWLLVLVIGVSYMSYKLLNSYNTIDMFYLIGAILVALVRFLTSYKELRKIIVELKETASFYL
jgi:hypothetical protein